MLTLFIGTDIARAKGEAVRRAAGSEVVRFGEGGETFDKVGGYLAQAGMFSPKLTLILDRPMGDAVGEALLIDETKALHSAEALVIVIEEKINAELKKKLPKGVEIEEFDLPVVAETESPSVFALTDAYTAGDRKRAWVTYRSLIMGGASAEEVHGTLSWAVRSMVLAGKTKTPIEAGMKDYPFRKARDAVRRVGLPMAESLSAELVDLYHRARSGAGTLEDLLEMFILKK